VDVESRKFRLPVSDHSSTVQIVFLWSIPNYFRYYNSMEECVANGQPFYFYSEMQTSCTAGIRQSCDSNNLL
jgi:hypothetical protein